MVVHVLKQTASRFEANFHVRDRLIMKQPLLVRGKNYYLIDTRTIYIMGFTKTIEQYLFGN